MKSFLVAFLLHLLVFLMLEEKSSAKITRCHKPENFESDESCQCDGKVCIRKCCQENQILNKKYSAKCIDGHNQKNLWEHLLQAGELQDIRDFNTTDSHLVVGFPCQALVFVEEDEDFTVTRKGELYFHDLTTEFCMDYVNATGKVLPAVCVPVDVEPSNIEQTTSTV